MDVGIVELDLHGLNSEEAKHKIDNTIKSAASSVYRIRLIHGYHGGTSIKRMINEEYEYGREARVLRICPGNNPGITEL